VSLKMDAKSRKEVLEQARQRYDKRGREGKRRLLDEVCELCGYERKYAIKVLRGKRAIIGSSGRKRGGSRAIYGVAEREVIKAIWLAAEQPCGKRLKAALQLWLPHYEKRRGPLAESLRQKVLEQARRASTGCWLPAGRARERELAAGRVPEPFCANRFRFAPNIGM
jgi:hypothetical protein